LFQNSLQTAVKQIFFDFFLKFLNFVTKKMIVGMSFADKLIHS